MMIEPQFLLMGGVAAVVGTLALVSRAQERKRRSAYEEYSHTRGFTFEPQRPDGARRFRDVFAPFNEGRRRTWGYTISGRKNEEPFIAFEYQWVTGSGQHSAAHRISGIVWERADVSFPQFTLTPERWFARLGELFGMRDFDFAESPEFSSAYRLKGTNEEAIRKLFTPDIRQFFAATRDQSVAGGGQFLFWWRSGRLPAADQLDEWLERGEHVRRRFFKS